LELRHLRYFVGVAEELHFGRAAARLGISQPPLSQQIRLLEEELGVPLFERTSRRVALTEPGRLFLAEARRTLEQADHAIDTARRAEAGETGELGIAFMTSVPFVPLVAGTMFAYSEAYPGVRLNLAELGRDEQFAGLVDRRIDIGFIRDADRPGLPPNLTAICVQEEPLLVAMRHDHRLGGSDTPLRVTDLAEERFILYSRHLGAGFNERLGEIFSEVGLTLRGVQEVSGIASLLGLVGAGFGITVLARSLSALHPEDIVYRVLDAPGAISRLWLVHRAEMAPTARRFVAMIDAEMRRSAEK
jgi:DNA-binding transcriptional LysR family regulator